MPSKATLSTNRDSVVHPNRTQTRQGIRTRYHGYGKWTVTDPKPSDGTVRQLQFRGDFDLVTDGHRAAAQAWLEKHVHDGVGSWRDDATVLNLGLCFGPDDYYWTWVLNGADADPIGGGCAMG